MRKSERIRIEVENKNAKKMQKGSSRVIENSSKNQCLSFNEMKTISIVDDIVQLNQKIAKMSQNESYVQEKSESPKDESNKSSNPTINPVLTKAKKNYSSTFVQDTTPSQNSGCLMTTLTSANRKGNLYYQSQEKNETELFLKDNNDQSEKTMQKYGKLIKLKDTKTLKTKNKKSETLVDSLITSKKTINIREKNAQKMLKKNELKIRGSKSKSKEHSKKINPSSDLPKSFKLTANDTLNNNEKFSDSIKKLEIEKNPVDTEKLFHQILEINEKIIEENAIINSKKIHTKLRKREHSEIDSKSSSLDYKDYMDQNVMRKK